ncbi:MAG: leucine-rich repeat domain-containing protein [Bacteroidales bacterium]
MMINKIVRLNVVLALLLSCTFLVACQNTHEVVQLSFSLKEESISQLTSSLNLRTDSIVVSKLSIQDPNFITEGGQSITEKVVEEVPVAEISVSEIIPNTYEIHYSGDIAKPKYLTRLSTESKSVFKITREKGFELHIMPEIMVEKEFNVRVGEVADSIIIADDYEVHYSRDAARRKYLTHLSTESKSVFKINQKKGSKHRVNAKLVLAIPDIKFRTYLLNNNYIEPAYTQDDVAYYKATKQGKTLTYMNVGFWSIRDLTGIELFPQLLLLACSDNRLTSLDVSKNPTLTWLRCEGNQLTSLDVSACKNLKGLVCYNNKLTSLDVTACPALTDIDCYNNKLISLDVSQNKKLSLLDCDKNQLSSLDISACTELLDLVCSNNQLTSLDVSRNIALIELWCGNNQLTTLDITKNVLLPNFTYTKRRKSVHHAAKHTSRSTSSQSPTIIGVSKNLSTSEGSLSNSLQIVESKSLHTKTSDPNKSDASWVVPKTLDAIAGNKEEEKPWIDDATKISKSIQRAGSRIALTRLECANNRLSFLDASKMAKESTGDYLLYCGNQRSNGTTPRQLNLRLRADQKTYWNNHLKKAYYNRTVTLTQ